VRIRSLCWLLGDQTQEGGKHLPPPKSVPAVDPPPRPSQSTYGTAPPELLARDCGWEEDASSWPTTAIYDVQDVNDRCTAVTPLFGVLCWGWRRCFATPTLCPPRIRDQVIPTTNRFPITSRGRALYAIPKNIA